MDELVARDAEAVIIQKAEDFHIRFEEEFLKRENRGINEVDEQHKETFLWKACEAGHELKALALLRLGADVNLAPYSTTPLYIAVRKGHSRLVSLLLRAGADHSLRNIGGQSKDEIGSTVLGEAAWSGRMSIMLDLLRAGADINCVCKTGSTPLVLAAFNGRASVVRELLQRGADPNEPLLDSMGLKLPASPLYFAVLRGFESIATMLLRAGANPNWTSRTGESSLILACERRNESMAMIMLESRADPNVATTDGMTALHVAIREDMEAVVHALLEAGANPNLTTNTGRTPLHLAAREGREDIVLALLRAGADPNVLDHDGLIPLLAAIDRDHLPCARLLAPRSIAASTPAGLTGLDLAVSYRYPDHPLIPGDCMSVAISADLSSLSAVAAVLVRAFGIAVPEVIQDVAEYLYARPICTRKGFVDLSTPKEVEQAKETEEEEEEEKEDCDDHRGNAGGDDGGDGHGTRENKDDDDDDDRVAIEI